MQHSVSVAIAEAIADTRGVDPTDLEYVLHEHIDVEAIEQLLARDDTSWTLAFELPDCEVIVTSEEEVVISERPPPA